MGRILDTTHSYAPALMGRIQPVRDFQAAGHKHEEGRLAGGSACPTSRTAAAVPRPSARLCENRYFVIVIDGIYYAAALAGAGVIVRWLAGPWFAVPLWLLAAFCLYFFRDPERAIPAGPVAVAPADGKVVAVKPEGLELNRVSIFLNIFDVHVNRAPIGGAIAAVEYHEGRFHVASREACSMQNEQNIVTVEGAGSRVVFKQIAGLIARRIVFNKKPGDRVSTGEIGRAHV